MSAQQPIQHTDEFVKRRTQNWLVLGLTYAAMYTARYNFSFANKSLCDEFGWTKAQIGVVISSATLLYGLAALFIAANLAMGLTFSTVAQTQQQAMQMSFFFMLPNILLSGFMFPWEAMPRPVQYLSQGLPLTHFLRIVRGIVLKGAGWSDVRHEVVWLACILAAFVAVASLRFRKKLG